MAVAVLLAAEMRSSDTPGPMIPARTIQLFDGKSLPYSETWLTGHTHSDPDKVVTGIERVDGVPAVRLSGQHWGGIVAKQRYRNHHLVAEYRWRLLTWGKRKDRARNSGVWVHCPGEHGSRKPDFQSPWMRSHEHEFMAGRTGDLIPVPGHLVLGRPDVRPSVRSTIKNPEAPVWNPDGTARLVERGNIGRIQRDPRHTDVLRYRGARDLDLPLRGWNRGEIVCEEDGLTFVHNRVTVNYAEGRSIKEGKILLQFEGAEFFFCRIELRPLTGAAPRGARIATRAVGT